MSLADQAFTCRVAIVQGASGTRIVSQRPSHRVRQVWPGLNMLPTLDVVKLGDDACVVGAGLPFRRQHPGGTARRSLPSRTRRATCKSTKRHCRFKSDVCSYLCPRAQKNMLHSISLLDHCPKRAYVLDSLSAHVGEATDALNGTGPRNRFYIAGPFPGQPIRIQPAIPEEFQQQ